MASIGRVWFAAVGTLVACACGGAASAVPDRARAKGAGLDGSRWTWVDASCLDGPLGVAELGFERELRIEAVGGALLVTYDDTLAARGCVRTEVWLATREADGVRLDPQAAVSLPPDAACGPQASSPLRGRLRHGADTLEIVEERSPWCRELDARFAYRRVPDAPLEPAQIVRRWAAHFNRRDARALAHLFAQEGSLVEPFTPTADGAYRRHRGRAEVRAWLDSAFGSTSWLALRLTGIDGSESAGEVAARWEYIDADLAEPVAGRTLFLLAGGEIYETEIQLLGFPRPRENGEGQPPARDAGPGAGS